MTKPTKKMIGRSILTHTMRKEVVDVPEWEGEILLRALSGRETAEFRDFTRKLDRVNDSTAELRGTAWLLVRSWVGEDGQPMLSAEDIDALLDSQTAVLLNRLGIRVMEISGMNREAAAGAEKNSVSSQSDDSGTPSPSPSAVAP